MTVSKALGSLRATSAQQICGLSPAPASPSALTSAGFAPSASGEPKSTKVIAAVPRTAWSIDDRPLAIAGMLCLSFAQARWTNASCSRRGSFSTVDHLRQRGSWSAFGKVSISWISLLTCSFVSVCASVCMLRMAKTAAPATSTTAIASTRGARTTCQKPCQPSVTGRSSSPARGMRTMRER